MAFLLAYKALRERQTLRGMYSATFERMVGSSTAITYLLLAIAIRLRTILSAVTFFATLKTHFALVAIYFSFLASMF